MSAFPALTSATSWKVRTQSESLFLSGLGVGAGGQDQRLVSKDSPVPSRTQITNTLSSAPLTTLTPTPTPTYFTLSSPDSLERT